MQEDSAQLTLVGVMLSMIKEYDPVRSSNPVKKKTPTQWKKKKKSVKGKRKKKRDDEETKLIEPSEEKKKRKEGQKLRLTLTVGPICSFNYENAIENRVMEIENT